MKPTVSSPWKTEAQSDGIFEYCGVRYALGVTDPVIESDYLARADGTYTLSECCLCVSLTKPLEKWNGEQCSYKLIAAVIQREGSEP